MVDDAVLGGDAFLGDDLQGRADGMGPGRAREGDSDMTEPYLDRNVSGNGPAFLLSDCEFAGSGSRCLGACTTVADVNAVDDVANKAVSLSAMRVRFQVPVPGVSADGRGYGKGGAWTVRDVAEEGDCGELGSSGGVGDVKGEVGGDRGRGREWGDDELGRGEYLLWKEGRLRIDDGGQRRSLAPRPAGV